jgi:gamma-glutamyltranspeptidase / glutathione hydrolase
MMRTMSTLDFHWQQPYASLRTPVLARNVVATSQPLAAQAGLRMLLAGGNAVDAAIATAAALTVVEPTMNGIGSDAFAILWDGSRLHGLNASGRSPSAWTPRRFANRDFMPTEGWDSVTVPGAVSGWVELSRRHGALPFSSLFEPAIAYAEDGFPVSPFVARQWQMQVPRLSGQPGFSAAFLPGGKAPQAGEIFRHPAQAKTLRLIAESFGEAFYTGSLADAMIACSAGSGGAMSSQDLANHRADWVHTLAQPYRGAVLHEIPPNGQGIASLMAMGLLRRFDLGSLGVDSADALHVQIEAMKLAFADVYRYVSDPLSMRISASDLLDPAYLLDRAKMIDLARAQDFGPGVPAASGTVYLTAADASGMMVSFIQSNYMGFGSGVVVPGTGISLQNRAAAFSLAADHPNRVAGGKRPFHTIIPGFLMVGDSPLMSFGVMGADMQAQGHVQITVRTVDFRQNVQAAIDAPRWKISAERLVLMEDRFDPTLLEGLAARGHMVAIRPFGSPEFGAAQSIRRLPDGYVAGSESRRDGQAVGF